MLDTGRLNPQYKGCEFIVAPLFDIHDNGKQKGFSLQMKLAGEKRFARKYAFYFETRSEADSACDQLNAWSKEYPECSGNPCSCPENEGYGCCNRASSPQLSPNAAANE